MGNKKGFVSNCLDKFRKTMMQNFRPPAHRVPLQREFFVTVTRQGGEIEKALLASARHSDGKKKVVY